jgi:hypothetical protein
MKLLLCFWCLEVLPVCLCREVKPFFIWFYPPWLDYDVSMHRLVELVVVIPTSHRSSKTESRCSSYGRFGFSCFCLFQGQRLRPWRAGDSGLGGPETPAQNVFLPFFIRSFGPEPPGTFPCQSLWPLGTGDSGPSLWTSKTRGVAQRRDGGRGFLAPAQSLLPPKAGDSGESGLQWLFSWGDL